MDAVDYLAGTDQVIETEMMMDLKIAILVRKKVAKYYMATHTGGSDDGHEHFIQVLSYCWGKLLPGSSSSTTMAEKRKSAPPDTNQPIVNRFQDLVLGAEEEDLTKRKTRKPSLKFRWYDPLFPRDYLWMKF